MSRWKIYGVILLVLSLVGGLSGCGSSPDDTPVSFSASSDNDSADSEKKRSETEDAAISSKRTQDPDKPNEINRDNINRDNINTEPKSIINNVKIAEDQTGERSPIRVNSQELKRNNSHNTNLPAGPIRSITDWQALGRSEPVRHILCSGSGALRLATYLDCSDRVIATEQLEKRAGIMSPYRLAHPEYADLPVFGEGHGRDNVEILLSMTPKPDLIIRIDNPGSGIDPETLQARTGIPVVLLPYGDFGKNRKEFDQSILLLGAVLNKEERARDLINFINGQIKDLRQRTSDIHGSKRISVYLGGLSYRGSHGINSTTSSYPPFEWLNLDNVASRLESDLVKAQQIIIAREQILVWNPDYLFLDLGTIGLGDSNGWTEIRDLPVFRTLNAVKEKKIYSLYPNNFYSANYEAVLANAWFIGSVVYPDRFRDIDPIRQADKIFHFMNGGPEKLELPDPPRKDLYRNMFDDSKENVRSFPPKDLVKTDLSRQENTSDFLSSPDNQSKKTKNSFKINVINRIDRENQMTTQTKERIER